MVVNFYRHGSAEFLGEEAADPTKLSALYDGGEPMLSGRGTSRVATVGGRKVIVKKEARGGILARFLPGKFLDLAPFNAEIELQEMMHEAELSFPILARAAFSDGLLWEIYTILPFFGDAVSLRDMIAAGETDGERAALAGRAVAGMHAAGLCHFDLNSGNVIFAEGRAMVIDFRGSYIYGAPLKRCLAAGNLLRLLRSLHKEAIRAGKAHDGAFERRLLEGYAEARGEEWARELAGRPAVSRLRLWSYKARF